MNRKDVGDRTEYLRRWYDSMISPVPDEEAQIPDFNYKIRPMDVYVPQQFNTVDRTIEDVKKKMIRDSEPAINPSYLTTKVPDVIDHNKLAMALINSKREYNESSSNMDQTALMNLGFSQQQITDLFGKSHTLDNIGISSNLQQNLEKINTLNEINAKLNVKEPGVPINNIKNVNIKNVSYVKKETGLTRDDRDIDSGDDSDQTYDEFRGRLEDRVRSKLDTSIDSNIDASRDSGRSTLEDSIYSKTEMSDNTTPRTSRYGTPEIDDPDREKIAKYEQIFTLEFEPHFKSGRAKADRYKVKNAFPYLLQIVQDIKKDKEYGSKEKINTESIKNSIWT